jgi:copper chaperone CopZ
VLLLNICLKEKIMKLRVLSSALALTLVAAVSASAGEVTVKGAHLCCGACSKDVTKALTDVEGVSDPASDRDAKTITFTAADDKAATAGLRKLYQAGFYGTATHGDKKVNFPGQKIDKEKKASEITLRGVHLCCGGCVTAAEKALKEVKGVKEVKTDREKRTITVTGEDVNLVAAVGALNKAGFSGRIPGEGKKKKKKDAAN